ncbi:MAG: hypothetical protein HY744_13550 [Deltaproteobacteria bacterium]|nr:hypothetical protein [Deltaproteobacteria bacterium]
MRRTIRLAGVFGALLLAAGWAAAGCSSDCEDTGTCAPGASSSSSSGGGGGDGGGAGSGTGTVHQAACAEIEELSASERTLGTAAALSFAAGGAGLGLLIYGVIQAASAPPSQIPPSATRAGLVLVPGLGGGALRGRF